MHRLRGLTRNDQRNISYKGKSFITHLYLEYCRVRWGIAPIVGQSAHPGILANIELCQETLSKDNDISAITNSWAEMRGGTCVFTCKGYREVTRLVGEEEDLRQMMESMKRIVTGLGLEEKGEETGDQMAELGEAEKCEEVIIPDNSTEGNRKGKATAGSIASEDRDTVIESEVEHGTEGEDTRQLIRSGTQFLATHRYEKNPDGPVGNELDLNEGDTVVYLMKNDDNEHWWLVEDGNGQVGYVPAAYLMIIVDETHQEEENDTNNRDGHERRADGTKIGGEMGQDGERSIQQQ